MWRPRPLELARGPSLELLKCQFNRKSENEQHTSTSENEQHPHNTMNCVVWNVLEVKALPERKVSGGNVLISFHNKKEDS